MVGVEEPAANSQNLTYYVHCKNVRVISTLTAWVSSVDISSKVSIMGHVVSAFISVQEPCVEYTRLIKIPGPLLWYYTMLKVLGPVPR